MADFDIPDPDVGGSISDTDIDALHNELDGVKDLIEQNIKIEGLKNTLYEGIKAKVGADPENIRTEYNKFITDIGKTTDGDKIEAALRRVNIPGDEIENIRDDIQVKNEDFLKSPLVENEIELQDLKNRGDILTKNTPIGNILDGAKNKGLPEEMSKNIDQAIDENSNITVTADKATITSGDGKNEIDVKSNEATDLNPKEEKAVQALAKDGLGEKPKGNFWDSPTTAKLIEFLKALLPFAAQGLFLGLLWHLIKKLVNGFIDRKNGCIYHSGTGDGPGTKLKNFTCDNDWKNVGEGADGSQSGLANCTFPKGFISVDPPCPNNGTLVTTDNTCAYRCFNTETKYYSQCMAYTTPTINKSGCPFGDKTVSPIKNVCPHYCTTGQNLASLVCKDDDKNKISAYCDCSIISCPSGATLEKVDISFGQGLAQMPLEAIGKAIAGAGKDIFGGEWWHYILYAIAGIIVIVGGYYLIRFMTGLFSKGGSKGKEEVDINVNKSKFRMKGKRKVGGKRTKRHSRK